MEHSTHRGAALWLAATCIVAAAPAAVAQTTTPAQAAPTLIAQTAAPAPAAPPATVPAPAAAPAADQPPPGFWIDGIHLSAQIEGGITVNPSTPDSGVNFGRLFDDRANQPMLNQVLLTANKPLDPKASFDWGFKAQFMYGSDARYTHSLGIFDEIGNVGDTTPYGQRNQEDIVEANFLLHVPFPTDGGMDIKAGIYPTPLGYEYIDPSLNPFYSHSYIFDFTLPFKHTGVLTTTHVTPLLDIYAGIDSGVNTTIGCCTADNNGSPGGIIGFGLNMMGGNLTLVVLDHMGPENPQNALKPLGFSANSYMRYYNDAVLTWKASDALTFATETSWVHDEFDGFFTSGKPAGANAYGIAGYMSYTISDTVTFNARAEVLRDDNGFFVAAFPGNNDSARILAGYPVVSPVQFANANTAAGKPMVLGEITIGLTFKPNLPAPVTGLLIRPEIRVDSALNGLHPYGNGNSGSVTAASDFVLTF
jgi:hypothetical protein